MRINLCVQTRRSVLFCTTLYSCEVHSARTKGSDWLKQTTTKTKTRNQAFIIHSRASLRAQDCSLGPKSEGPKIEAESGGGRGSKLWGAVSSPTGVRGEAPTAQRFSTLFSTQDGLCWHYGLSCSHCGGAGGGKIPVSPCVRAPVFAMRKHNRYYKPTEMRNRHLLLA